MPHSEIRGSKLIISSSRLIADYHVLHRLLLPRHPPNALFALDLIQEKQGLLHYLLPHPEGQIGSEVIYFPTPAGSQGYIWVSVLDLDNTARFRPADERRVLEEPEAARVTPKGSAPTEACSHSNRPNSVVLYLSLRCQSADFRGNRRCPRLDGKALRLNDQVLG